VTNVVCSPLACLLSFTSDFSGLVASLPSDSAAGFPPPKETYTARRVRLRGKIKENNGRPRIEVRDPGQIELLDVAVGVGASRMTVARPPDDAPPPEADAESGTDVVVAVQQPDLTEPAPVAEAYSDAAPLETPTPPHGGSRVIDPGRFERRLGGPRGAREPAEGDGLVSDLRRGGGEATVEIRSLREQVARLEETTRGLAETVAALQERLTVLEQTRAGWNPGVDPSALPETRSYVVSGDPSTRVQPIKRGWSSERVLRSYGAPLNTSTEANGYMTWYYGNGRAVTIDPKGRVSSSVGF